MIDAETYGAAVGAAERYTDEHSGSGDAVKYTEQDLTTAQQAQARTNIGAAASDDIPTDAVKYTAQTLTDAQKTQARTNIGAASTDSVPTTLAELSDDSTHRLVTDTEKTTWNNMIPLTAKGASSGVAELDSNGKVPSNQLPSYVDDVIEGYYKSSDDRFYEESTFITLITPVAGKAWIDIPTNKSYRWTGSVYVRVDEGVQIGETADTAYAGNKGKANADAIAAIKDGVSIDSFSDVETALAGKVDAVQGKGLSTNDYTSAEKTKLAGLENYDDTGIQEDISAIEEVIPSKATSQNPLVTEEDIPTDAVKYTAQTLTDAQKTQARTNIGAGTSDFSGSYSDLTNAPPLVKGGGYGGNTIGGTGVNTNTTRYANSIAYGNSAVATANYAFAFGDNATAGNYNRSTGKHAVAIGNNVRAEKDYEFAYGKFNQSNTDTAFSFGDGTSENARHNLMELKTDGTLLLNGKAVKTEGGDDNNKLRLGQIWGMKLSAGNSVNHLPAYGFAELCKKISPSTNYVKYVTFSSDDTATIESSLYVHQFGDFVGYITSPTSTTASVSVKVQPLKGRTLGKPTTGTWISVENCYFMFLGCREVESLDLSMFDTSKVTNMLSMFYNCIALSSLDLTSFDTGEVTNMGNMFYNCIALTTLDISSFDLTNVTAYGGMFGSATGTAPPLTTLKTPKINPHDDIPLNQTLYSQDGTAYTNLPVTTGTSIELRQSWT